MYNKIKHSDQQRRILVKKRIVPLQKLKEDQFIVPWTLTPKQEKTKVNNKLLTESHDAFYHFG